MIDVGAGTGTFTWLFARCVGPSGCVIAVEPNPYNHPPLQKLARSRRVMVIETAVSNMQGELKLGVPVVRGSQAWGLARLGASSYFEDVEEFDVQVTTIDEISRDQTVSFIKCDVEGHELQVFQGATTVLDRDAPSLFVEIEQRHLKDPIANVFDFFTRRGYVGYGVAADRLLPIGEFDAARDQDRTGWSNEFASPPGYIADFLFVPPARASGLANLVGPLQN